MSRGVFRSVEERERLVSGWKASGLSLPVYAKQEGVPLSTLYQWIVAARRALPAPRIVRVIRKASVAPPDGGGLVVEVGSARIRVTPGFDRETLASVLDVLDGQGRGCAA